MFRIYGDQALVLEKERDGGIACDRYNKMRTDLVLQKLIIMLLMLVTLPNIVILYVKSHGADFQRFLDVCLRLYGDHTCRF